MRVDLRDVLAHCPAAGLLVNGAKIGLGVQVEQHARRVLDECLQGDSLTAGQYMALSLVVHHEPASSADLARRARITAQGCGTSAGGRCGPLEHPTSGWRTAFHL